MEPVDQQTVLVVIGQLVLENAMLRKKLADAQKTKPE